VSIARDYTGTPPASMNRRECRSSVKDSCPDIRPGVVAPVHPLQTDTAIATAHMARARAARTAQHIQHPGPTADNDCMIPYSLDAATGEAEVAAAAVAAAAAAADCAHTETGCSTTLCSGFVGAGLEPASSTGNI
jgi:hypothetical protein